VRAADPDALTVRTSWVYAGGSANFATSMLRLMRERERLEVVADQIGSPTSANSLALALWALALEEASGLLHYCDAGPASRLDFAMAIQEEACALGLLARKIPIDPVPMSNFPAPAARPAFSALDPSDAALIIGAPPQPWRISLRLALEEIRANG
jgi:dTDP-4-dehydrorhamnose reductase